MHFMSVIVVKKFRFEDEPTYVVHRTLSNLQRSISLVNLTDDKQDAGNNNIFTN